MHPIQEEAAQPEPPRAHDVARRPKVLFLARPFPPLRVTASVRTWNLAKYLARSDWDVTVVTPHPSVWAQVDSRADSYARLYKEGIKQILTDHYVRWLMPYQFNVENPRLNWLFGGAVRTAARYLNIDSGVGWIRPVSEACSSLTRKDVDVIVATGAPFASFQLAYLFSDRLSCPYVLDYRDPWTQNPHATRRFRRDVVMTEARLLASSAAVTVVSSSWGESIGQRFGVSSKVHVVSNGYDPEEVEGVKPLQFGHFAIVHAGNFYPPKRVISPIMAALRQLKLTNNVAASDWRFHYYGSHGDHVHEEARRYGVVDRVALHGAVTRQEVLSATRGAAVGVVITSVSEQADQSERGIVPGKIFEIMGLRTPILMIAPSASDASSIVESGGYGRSFTGLETDATARFLRDLMQGRILKGDDPTDYAWTGIAKRFDSLLRIVVANAAAGNGTRSVG